MTGMTQIKATDMMLNQLYSYYQPYEGRKIWREECVYCYNNARTNQQPFYICLKNYIGFCSEHVNLYLDATQKFFVATTSTKVSSDPPEKVPAKPGVAATLNSLQEKYIDEFELVCGNMNGINSIECNLNLLPSEMVILLQTDYLSLSRCDAFATLDDFETPISKHSETLVQVENPPIVPSSGWQCQYCGLEGELWLNLTDGVVCCGRSYYDGSGGKNHSPEHFKKTGYPLVVKLSTLDPATAEVYSYDEDTLVRDTNLDKHLGHFNLKRNCLKKTEKTMLEKEIDLNLNIKNEMDVVLERGVRLQPLFGPGYTGIINMGNTCYFSSVLQFFFSLPEMVSRYTQPDFPMPFSQKPPTLLIDDVYFQLSKLCHHLYSGFYSHPILDENGVITVKGAGLCPYMLKAALTRSHPEFKTSRQQDVSEFFMHLCQTLSIITSSFSTGSLSIDYLFDFRISEYYQLLGSETDIQQRTSTEKTLCVPIPPEEPVLEVSTADNEHTTATEGLNGSGDATPATRKLEWDKCLEGMCNADCIDNIVINGRNGPALCFRRLASFPQYLVLQVCRFFYNPSAKSLIKLDVSLTPPKLLDLSAFVELPDLTKSHNYQPFEEVLSETDECMISEISGMGFSRSLIIKALKETHSVGVKEAIEWLISRPNPCISLSDSKIADSINFLSSMGFSQESAKNAIEITDGDTEQALEYLLANPDTQNISLLDCEPQKTATTSLDPSKAKYELLSFITHIGASPTTGHYVCHVYKDDHWVLFNDESVAESVEPPLDRGYLYFYRRKRD